MFNGVNPFANDEKGQSKSQQPAILRHRLLRALLQNLPFEHVFGLPSAHRLFLQNRFGNDELFPRLSSYSLYRVENPKVVQLFWRKHGQGSRGN